jgi:hypothetical protein
MAVITIEQVALLLPNAVARVRRVFEKQPTHEPLYPGEIEELNNIFASYRQHLAERERILGPDADELIGVYLGHLDAMAAAFDHLLAKEPLQPADARRIKAFLRTVLEETLLFS